MSNFENLTLAEIPGQTPREKFSTIVKMKDVLRAIAYPRRGTDEETKTREEFAVIIQGIISAYDEETTI